MWNGRNGIVCECMYRKKKGEMSWEVNYKSYKSLTKCCLSVLALKHLFEIADEVNMSIIMPSQWGGKM